MAAPGAAKPNWLNIFKNVLEAGVDDLLQEATDSLTSDHKDRLALIYDHFTADGYPDSDSADSSDQESGQASTVRSPGHAPPPPPKPKPGEKRKRAQGKRAQGKTRPAQYGLLARTPMTPTPKALPTPPQTAPQKRKAASPTGGDMKRFCNMALADITIDTHAQRLLDGFERHDGDPKVIVKRFLHDQAPLTNDLFSQRVDEPQAELLHVDVFLSTLAWSRSIDRQIDINRLRWLFSLLFYFDLTTKVIKPDGHGSRVGRLMRQHYRDFILRIPPDHLGPGSTPDSVCDDLALWSNLGRKLNIICREFGPGCLMFLSSKLSKDYLMHKFRESGDQNKAAFLHLHSLKLAQVAESSGANRFAQATRDFLFEPYREQAEAANASHAPAPVASQAQSQNKDRASAEAHHEPERRAEGGEGPETRDEAEPVNDGEARDAEHETDLASEDAAHETDRESEDAAHETDDELEGAGA